MLNGRIQQLRIPNRNCFDPGVQIFELVHRVHPLYLKLKGLRKKILVILLSNCNLAIGIHYPIYRKSLEILVKGLQNENLLGVVDDFRTFLAITI